MSKILSALLLLSFSILSCTSIKTLHSTTFINVNDEFILGNNVHDQFKVRVTNTSNQQITIWQYPLEGGRHSLVNLMPSTSTFIEVAKNTSLRFENHSKEEVALKLKVKGDLGLSMGYKN